MDFDGNTGLFEICHMSCERYLLVVGGVPRQIGEVNELHVKSPELGQDAAAG